MHATPNPHHDDGDLVPLLEAAIDHARAQRHATTPKGVHGDRRETVLAAREARHLRLVRDDEEGEQS